MEKVKCDLCGEENFRPLYKGHDYLTSSQIIFELKKCKNCGLVNLNPRPENIANYYGKYQSGPDNKDIFDCLNPNRKKIVERFKKGGRILDIGCGKGDFLNLMRENNWDIFGVEISKDACDFAIERYGLKNISNKDLLSLDFPDNYFDVVTLWHVLEHLNKPQDTLKKIYKILKIDGLLLIESPNFQSLQSRIFRDKWFNLDLPRHLYQFSPKILKKYLKKTDFKIIGRDYFVNPRVNFVSFKMSALRFLKIQKLPELDEKKKTNFNTYYLKNKIFWRLFRLSLTLFSLVFSLLLDLAGCDDSFRVYCKKADFRTGCYKGRLSAG